MSSIIVLDSSDEETDSVKKKQRIGPASKTIQPTPVQTPMARVNPLKGVTTSIIKKSGTQPQDNFKIHLPSKRSTSNEPSADQVPEKRVRRLKPTTVVRSSDEEWLNRQKPTTQQAAPGVPMLSKNLVNSVKGPVRVVKSPVTVGSPSRVIVSPAPISKSPSNYVRVAWNGKDPKPSSPPVINKIITACAKEQPKTATSPAVINKSVTTSVKDQTKVVSVTPPIFNNNSVTIRRVLVNEERPKPIVKNSITTTACRTEQSKQQPVTNMSATIRRVPLSVDPLKITMTPSVPNKNNNNSAVKLTNVAAGAALPLSASSTSIKKITMTTDPLKISPQAAATIVKRNQNVAKPMRNGDGTSAAITSAPTILHVNPAPIQRIVTVDLPKTPASPPVITKNYNSAPKQQSKSSMSMSVITKNNSMPVKTSEQKMSPPVGPKPSVIMNRPSGLIVTPITCTGGTTTTETISRSLPTASRSVSKQQTKTTNRTRASLVPSEHSMATITPSMMNMFPPGTAGFMGNQILYDMDSSGRAYINPAYMPNRSMRSLENNNFPNMSPPAFNVNYPSFSGGSITPVQGAGNASNASYNTTRSSKSPATSTITKSSNNARSPAGFMGTPIDVDQPMPRMSPPVFNMNHAPINGDPFSLMRNPNNIPSRSYSPVRSTKSPKGDSLENATSAKAPASPVFHRDLDNFVKNPFSYPQAPCITATSSALTGSNGPIYSLDSPARNNHHTGGSPPGFFKSPASTITSPAHSTISEGSSVSEFLNNIPPNGDEKSQKPTKEQNDKNKTNEENDKKDESAEADNKVVEEQEEEEEKEPLNPEFETLLTACREADSSEDMSRLIESKLLRYYYSVHPDFVKSRGFRKAVVAATENIKKNPDLVYYHLRPVVEEMKARIKSKAAVITNDETSEAAATKTSTDEGIADKVRNRQIRRLNKGLYILTRKIHKLENDEVDLDDENSSYLIVERYKKRACEIYDKICDLTGESKHALRQVKKPIQFKDTDYPKFNKVVETFVNRTKEFPDFFDVLRMLEFCNERYNFGLLKEEMTTIAQDAFIKIGKLLQSRRKADLYETVSHFTSDCEDPAANDPALLAKLSENEKNQTSIGSIINKYAREQVRRKAESANATGDELNHTTGSCDSDTQSHDDVKSNNNNNNDSDKKKSSEESKETPKATTNGTHSPPPSSPHIISSSSPSPSAGTSSSAFRTSPPHAFASPQASPRTRWPSPTLPPPTATQSWSSNSLKILSVTSLNDSASSQILKADNPTATSIDEIIISDEDL